MPRLDAGHECTVVTPVQLSLLLAVVTAVPVMQDRLQLLDVVCLMAFPFLLRDVARDHRVLLLISTAAFWAMGQILADEVNGLGLDLSLPFAFAVTVLAIAPTLVSLAREDFRRMRFLALGVVAGLVLEQIAFERLPLGDPASWKYGLNVPLSLVLLAGSDLAWQRGHRMPSFLALAAICGIGLWSDHRGLAGIAVLTALLAVLPRRRHRYPRFWSLLAALVLLFGALGAVFVESATSGILGERSARQVERYGSNPVTLIINVRPELYQEVNLFWQQPLTGFGSQPHLDTSAYNESLQFARSVGVIRTTELREEWLHGETPGVSAHSMAADTWVRAGVSAVPFWTLALVLALWAGTTGIRFRSSPLVVMWTMLLLWDIFFSPMVGMYHIQLATYLALAVVTVTTAPATPLRIREKVTWRPGPFTSRTRAEGGGDG